MFLAELFDEDKAKFLELAYKAGNVDNSFTAKEIVVLNRYKKELGLSKIPVTASRDELVEYFSHANILTKKIVYFELLGMVFADDGKYNEAESKFIDMVGEKFQLDKASMEDMKDVAKALEQAYSAAHVAIFG